MNKLTITSLATAFAAASTLAVLAGGLQSAPVSHGGILSAAPAVALADKDDSNHANSKHAGDPNYYLKCKSKKHDTDDQKCKYKKIKHGHHDDMGGLTTINGTVVSVSGNLVSFRLDNGQVVSVLDNNGTQLNVGQHYRLRGGYQNGQFVLGAANNGYNNGGNQHTTNVSGNIVAVGNGTVTLLGVPPVVINVQQAINNNATNGSLSVGRHITAYGYYSNNVFYATSIQ